MTKENDDNIEEEESIEKGEIAIGAYAAHLKTTKLGMYDYGIWWDLTCAVISMGRPNDYHRVDLRDKETLKKLEKDMNLEIDYEKVEAAILKDPFLIRPNGAKPPVDRTKDEQGKPLSKKALKTMAKRDKVSAKVDALKKKYKAIKNKKCDRAIKLSGLIEEMEKKRDRIL